MESAIWLSDNAIKVLGERARRNYKTAMEEFGAPEHDHGGYQFELVKDGEPLAIEVVKNTIRLSLSYVVKDGDDRSSVSIEHELSMSELVELESALRQHVMNYLKECAVKEKEKK